MASRDGTSDEEKEDGRGCLRVDPYWIRDFGVFSNVFIHLLLIHRSLTQK